MSGLMELIGVKEAADQANVSIATMRRWAEAGKVAAKKIGKAWVIDPLSIPQRPETLRKRIDRLIEYWSRDSMPSRLPRKAVVGSLMEARDALESLEEAIRRKEV